jgi:phytoene/squalene synthetase
MHVPWVRLSKRLISYAILSRILKTEVGFIFTELQKKEIEADIQADFDAGLRGIENLPKKAKKGVLLAYEYYIRLFEKIKQVPVERLKSERIRVPDWEKLMIYLRV